MVSYKKPRFGQNEQTDTNFYDSIAIYINILNISNILQIYLQESFLNCKERNEIRLFIFISIFSLVMKQKSLNNKILKIKLVFLLQKFLRPAYHFYNMTPNARTQGEVCIIIRKFQVSVQPMCKYLLKADKKKLKLCLYNSLLRFYC